MAGDSLERNKGVVRAQAEAINRRDLKGVRATTRADVVRHCQATPDVEVRSLEQFEAFLTGDWEVFPDSRMTIHQLLAEEDRVALFGSYEATQTGPFGPFPATGKPMRLDFASFFRIEDGQVAEIWVTWDNLAALSQLGHFPPDG